AFEYIDVALPVHRHCAWVHQRCVDSHDSVLGNATFTVAGDSPDQAGFQIDGAHAAVVEISEIKVLALRVERGAVKAAELRLLRWSAVATVAFCARPREGAHCAAPGVKLTNALVPGVRQKQVSVGKDGQTVHAVELRLLARSVIAGKTLRASPRNNVEHTIPAHSPNALTSRHLDEIQIAGGVEIHAEGRDEFRSRGWGSIFLGASARHQHQAICPGNERKQNQTGENKAMGVHECCHYSVVSLCHSTRTIGLTESSEIPPTRRGAPPMKKARPGFPEPRLIISR